MLRRWTLLTALALAPACNVDPYHLSFARDGGVDAPPGDPPDAAPFDAPPSDAPPPPDAGPDACVPRPEACNYQDDDCDGLADEVFDLLSDPRNCGGCLVACSRPNMYGTCEAGTCAYECLAGFWDLDPVVDGCEYACIQTNGGVEACDGLDNDCDDLIDEDFDLATDVDNCGACGRPCLVTHATPACQGSTCTYTACDRGYADVLPGVAGCEYACPSNPPAVETCDGVDNDCDGLIDDGNPGGGAPCGSAAGECRPGATTCRFGMLACEGSVGPAPEVCDGLDNDCDGRADEDYDKNRDVQHCGGCSPCAVPNAVAACMDGSCAVALCQPGWVDLDLRAGNGCEYACTPLGPEVCDGLDNDCDGLTDVADPGLIVPANFCMRTGACAGTAPTCTAAACDSRITWRCQYGPGAELDACGALEVQEVRCDGMDGDCDGVVDDAFPLKGAACHDARLGACQGSGSLACNAAGDGLYCAVTEPGATPAPESCNGVDDDCDGAIDEGAPDDMVRVVDGVLDFWIYRYEAARPDAASDDDGVLDHRACSKPGVMPWSGVTWPEADAACRSAGKRLCTEAEWQAACEGASRLAYPYGDVYDPEACNGNDYDVDCADPDEDLMLPTGTPLGCPPASLSRCTSPTGAVDMSGNLKEWTGTRITASPSTYRIRGGAFDNVAAGLTCQFDFIAAEPAYFFGNLGFRCCSSAGL